MANLKFSARLISRRLSSAPEINFVSEMPSRFRRIMQYRAIKGFK